MSHMAYRESTQPGRYISFKKQLARSIVLIYIPPFLICLAIAALLIVFSPGAL